MSPCQQPEQQSSQSKDCTVANPSHSSMVHQCPSEHFHGPTTYVDHVQAGSTRATRVSWTRRASSPSRAASRSSSTGAARRSRPSRCTLCPQHITQESIMIQQIWQHLRTKVEGLICSAQTWASADVVGTITTCTSCGFSCHPPPLHAHEQLHQRTTLDRSVCLNNNAWICVTGG